MSRNYTDVVLDMLDSDAMNVAHLFGLLSALYFFCLLLHAAFTKNCSDLIKKCLAIGEAILNYSFLVVLKVIISFFSLKINIQGFREI